MGQPFDPHQLPQQYPQPHVQGYPPPQKKSMGCGMIALIVAIIAVPVIGIFAALAIHGVNRYLSSAKGAEAKNTVGAIARAAQEAYEKNGRLCGSSTRAPALVPSGTKVAPSPDDFATGDAENGWKCLRFSVEYPTYFSYGYEVTGADSFKVTALGDLDGDGEQSSYTFGGKVLPDGRFEMDTQFDIVNEGE